MHKAFVAAESLFCFFNLYYRKYKNVFLICVYSGKKRYYIAVSLFGLLAGWLLSVFLNIPNSPFTIISAGGVAALVSFLSIEMSKETKNKDAEEKVYYKFEDTFWEGVDDFDDKVLSYLRRRSSVAKKHNESKEGIERIKARTENLKKIRMVWDKTKNDEPGDYGFSGCQDNLAGYIKNEDAIDDAEIERMLEGMEEFSDFRKEVLSSTFFAGKAKSKILFYFDSVKSFQHISDDLSDSFEKALINFFEEEERFFGSLVRSIEDEDDVYDMGSLDEKNGEMFELLKKIRDRALSSFDSRSIRFLHAKRVVFSGILFLVFCALGYNAFSQSSQIVLVFS